MVVYLDRPRAEDAREKLERLLARASSSARLGPGLERHAELVTLLIEAGELAQAVADERFAERGRDELDELTQGAMGLALSLARAVEESLRRRFGGRALELSLRAGPLLALLPRRLRISPPEGYAHYAVYPESYVAAARALRPEGQRLVVIGIRTIGTGLAAAVAAAAGARTPVTVRPVGSPSARELESSPALASALFSAAASAHYALVDEGPGASGTSFGSVAELLRRGGVPRRRVHLFPSHAGAPGASASPEVRAWWATADRRVLPFEALFGARAPLSLRRMAAGLLGQAEAPLEDLSAGQWRRRFWPNERDWPPAHLQQERRKYLLRGERGAWLLKFAGLGRYGEPKLPLSRALAERGFAPEVAGLRHGWLVQRWLDEALPLPASRGVDRRVLAGRVGEYLALRCRWGADARDGATPEELLAMTRHNARLAVGAAAGALSRFEPWVPRLARDARPVKVDARMHAWEWLVLPDGRLLKADGVDHHAAHDLVGCQDIAWDVAGAEVELSLDATELELVVRQLSRERAEWSGPESLPFYRACYLAFQLGRNALAAGALEASFPAESARLRRAVERYAQLLRRELRR